MLASPLISHPCINYKNVALSYLGFKLSEYCQSVIAAYWIYQQVWLLIFTGSKLKLGSAKKIILFLRIRLFQSLQK